MFKFVLVLKIFFISLFVMASEFYNFSFESIEGEKISFNTYKNKVVLLVNTASMCGFTKQYGGLETLYNNYKEKGFVILGIPSNSFMQEHSSEEKVKDFCETNFNITFPMTKIVNVIGTGRHPLYSWLNDAFEIKPKWNFYKILIDRNGNFVDAFSSLTKPNSPKLIKIIEDKIEG